MLRDAWIGALRLETWPSNLDDCFLIDPDGFQGWDGGTQIRRNETPRPVAHGSFPSRGYQSARVVSFSGTMRAPSPRALRNKRDILAGTLADGGLGRLTVDTTNHTLWADVYLAGVQCDVLAVDAREAEFQLQLWAPDPRKYGQERVFAAARSTTVFHYGNAQAYPVVELAGVYPSGYVIRSDDRSYAVNRGLTGGSVDRIDMRTGRLTRNGVLQTGAVTQADILTVPPGGAAPIAVMGSGTGELTVRVLDTFF